MKLAMTYSRINRILLVVLVGILSSCTNPMGSESKPGIDQGVWGFIKSYEGNFMPGLDSEVMGEIKPVKTIVCIFELTYTEDAEWIEYSSFYRSVNSKIVEAGMSDNKGYYEISLPEGTYSIFVILDGKYYAFNYGGMGEISPFTVRQDSVTRLDLDITYKAYF